MNDGRAISQKLSNGFNPRHRSCHSGQQRANEVVGCFFTSSWTKKLGRTDSLSVSILWESIVWKLLFKILLIIACQSWKDTVPSSAVSSSMYWSPLNLFCRRQQGAKYNNKAHATRHQRFLSEKNDEPHDARKQEPPAPPKEVNVSKLKGQVIHSWTFLTFTPPDDNNNTCYFARVISSA